MGRISGRVVLASALAALLCTGCTAPWTRIKKLEAQNASLQESNAKLAEEVAALAVERDALRELLNEKERMIEILGSKDQKEKTELRKAELELQKVREQLKQLARGIEGVDQKDGVLRVGETLLFSLGKADIKPAGKDVLKKVAEILHGRKELVRIDGHTDNIPVKKAETVKRFGDNEGLAAARAIAVLRVLKDEGKIRRDRMFIRGFHSARPVATNQTAKGREQNRRVEIAILPELGGEMPAAAEEPAVETPAAPEPAEKEDAAEEEAEGKAAEEEPAE